MKLPNPHACAIAAVLALASPKVVAQDALTRDLQDHELTQAWASTLDTANDTRFRWDFSLRVVHAAGVPRRGLLSAVGADFHKVFSTAAGDIGTLRLQGYALHADGLPSTPGIFDDAHDWEWTYRICDFNFTRFAASGFNLRIGHYEIPYGLEQTQNTNGTLRQYLSSANLGIKTDWGMTINAQRATHEFELSLSRGSGRYWKNIDRAYVLAGRVGTPREENFAIGASFMSSRLPSDGLTRRERVGLDAIWTLPAVTLLAELNLGKNDTIDAASGLLELNCSTPDEGGTAFLQLLGTETDGDDKYWANLGAAKHLGAGVMLSTQWQVDLDALNGSEPSERIMFQLRYRF